MGLLKNKVPVVALDTSALLCVCENKIDLFSDVEKELGTVKYVVPGSVIYELKKLAEKNKNKNRSLNLLLNIFNKKNVEVLCFKNKEKNKNRYADKEFLSMDFDYFCTCDLELANKLKEKGKKGFILMKGKYFKLC